MIPPKKIYVAIKNQLIRMLKYVWFSLIMVQVYLNER